MTTISHSVLEGELVEAPTGPNVPPPMPAPGRNPHTISMYGASLCTTVGVGGVVTTALTSPDMVMWPIWATLAAIVATGVNSLRHQWWQADNAGVCEFVRTYPTV
jgi:hypothetical protein